MLVLSQGIEIVLYSPDFCHLQENHCFSFLNWSARWGRGETEMLKRIDFNIHDNHDKNLGGFDPLSNFKIIKSVSGEESIIFI